MGKVQVPLVTTNRFNTAEDCEAALAAGAADMVSMARPFWPIRIWCSRPDCLGPRTSTRALGATKLVWTTCPKQSVVCLVNPRACHETEHSRISTPTTYTTREWPTGLALDHGRGIRVAVEDAPGSVRLWNTPELGPRSRCLNANRTCGQFLLPKHSGQGRIQGNHPSLRNQLAHAGVEVLLNTPATTAKLAEFDKVVLASGVTPRPLHIPGSDRPEVVSVLTSFKEGVPGKRVAGGGWRHWVRCSDSWTHDADEAGS